MKLIHVRLLPLTLGMFIGAFVGIKVEPSYAQSCPGGALGCDPRTWSPQNAPATKYHVPSLNGVWTGPNNQPGFAMFKHYRGSGYPVYEFHSWGGGAECIVQAESTNDKFGIACKPIQGSWPNGELNGRTMTIRWDNGSIWTKRHSRRLFGPRSR